MIPEEYFKKWSENCRIFTDYKPIHSHEDMMQFAKDYHTEQLLSVVDNNDQVVVELSDEELKIITRKELEQWQKDAIEFDGFEGWIVKGKLVKNIVMLCECGGSDK